MDEFDGFSGLLAAQDVLEAVLQKTDAAALCQLKAASVGWGNHVRRELCNRLWVRLCRREGQPEPAGVDSITDLDVECLNEAGRPWEVVVAGRQLPQLARLHGWGFVVDVQAVREADLGAKDEEEDEENYDEEDEDAPLGGYTLRRCIQGKGQPPDELLLAAVACAASGTVCGVGGVRGVPVQRLREDDAIGALDLPYSGIGVTGAALLALMLPATTSVRSLNLGYNKIGVEGASALVALLKETQIRHLDLEYNNLGPEGGAAIAEGLKGNSTLQSLNLGGSSLTNYGKDMSGLLRIVEILPSTKIESLGLSTNEIGIAVEYASALVALLKETQIRHLDLTDNDLFDGITAEGITAEGITKICEALKGSAVTSLNVSSNYISGDAAETLAKVVLEHASMTNFCGIPLASLRENSITELNLDLKRIPQGVGVPGAIVLSKLLPSAAALTSLNLDGNQLCNEHIHSIHSSSGQGTYTLVGIIKLCEALKGSAVASLDLSSNNIGDEGASALAAILKETQITTLKLNGNKIGVAGVSALAAVLKETMISNLDVGGNRIGDEGASALAAVLKETQITNLKIDHGKIRDKGASALTAILKETQITSLDLYNNYDMSNQAKQAVRDVVGSGVSIKF